uniref:Uncharacterized protein n=1 Tax=Arundo donax TaxID=35708 RepID=A0A0A9AN84_ARUDO
MTHKFWATMQRRSNSFIRSTVLV